ncbi:MAG TPA: AAC(3) family N-acetyltransferase [Actinotalea sp.]
MTVAASPVLRESLADDLRALGVREGGVLLAHASLSRLGWVAGGEQTVVLALQDALGPDGTLVMPSQSWQLCDPEYLADPRVPPHSWDAVRAGLPAYDAAWTPTRTMGAVVEALRAQPGTVRSSHPHRSFVARGPHAAEVVARHELTDPVGEGSPLSAVDRLDGQVLLLGVGHEKNTSLHLAEARSGLPTAYVRNGAPMLVDGRRQWIAFEEPVVDDADFGAVGRAFAAAGGERSGPVGHARASLMGQRELVRFAAHWFAVNRRRTPPAPAG